MIAVVVREEAAPVADQVAVCVVGKGDRAGQVDGQGVGCGSAQGITRHGGQDGGTAGQRQVRQSEGAVLVESGGLAVDGDIGGGGGGHSGDDGGGGACRGSELVDEIQGEVERGSAVLAGDEVTGGVVPVSELLVLARCPVGFESARRDELTERVVGIIEGIAFGERLAGSLMGGIVRVPVAVEQRPLWAREVGAQQSSQLVVVLCDGGAVEAGDTGEQRLGALVGVGEVAGRGDELGEASVAVIGEGLDPIGRAWL